MTYLEAYQESLKEVPGEIQYQCSLDVYNNNNYNDNSL